MIRDVMEVRRGVAVAVDGEPRSMLARGAGGEDDRPLEAMSLGSTLGDSAFLGVDCDCSLDTDVDVSMRA